eukprot:5835221-Pyramimonas_sp.AAC.1
MTTRNLAHERRDKPGTAPGHLRDNRRTTEAQRAVGRQGCGAPLRSRGAPRDSCGTAAGQPRVRRGN